MYLGDACSLHNRLDEVGPGALVASAEAASGETTERAVMLPRAGGAAQDAQSFGHTSRSWSRRWRPSKACAGSRLNQGLSRDTDRTRGTPNAPAPRDAEAVRGTPTT